MDGGLVVDVQDLTTLIAIQVVALLAALTVEKCVVIGAVAESLRLHTGPSTGVFLIDQILMHFEV